MLPLPCLYRACAIIVQAIGLHKNNYVSSGELIMASNEIMNFVRFHDGDAEGLPGLLLRRNLIGWQARRKDWRSDYQNISFKVNIQTVAQKLTEYVP